MAVIKLHNTLSGEKEVFKPIVAGTVGIYSCGPTVYDRIHIGNVRAFIFADILRRMFEWNDYKVILVRNITDVDDKTIKRSIAEKISLLELTKKYEDLYVHDMNQVNVLSPTLSPKATENIPEMIKLIKVLLEKGLAYKADDGIYFSISKSKGYGKLAGLDIDNISQQERIANDEYDKENPQDFALWKFWTKEDGDNFWETDLGKGRPGWHIECSAMASKFLGETFDIHTGGIDLIFPHHTNEIAQTDGANEKPLANYWLHNSHILVDGKRMAKSAKNFYTLKDLEEKKIQSLSLRYWLLTAHYKTLVNFTFEAVMGFQETLRRLVIVLAAYPDNGIVDITYIKKFTTFINDDLDTPKAIALMWKLINDSSISLADKKVTIYEFDKVFGLNLKEAVEKFNKDSVVPEFVEKLLIERSAARDKKDFKKSDEIRKALNEAGYKVEDVGEDSKLSKL